MKPKRILSIVLCLVLMVCTAGCGEKKQSDVPQPDMAMKTVTQNSLEDYVTFEFELPEDWLYAPDYEHSLTVNAAPKSVAGQSLGILEQLPYILYIGNYCSSYLQYGKEIPEEIKQIHQDLLSGNPETYKASINRPPYALTNDENSEPPLYGEDYIGDFQYTLYQGKYGKIAQVTYNYKIEGKEFHTIECFCEQLFYKVTGHFDDSVEVSSGDIALWVANSLKIQENFILKDGKIEKKG